MDSISQTAIGADAACLLGLRVGHVRVIFKLPLRFGVLTAEPLAYVEWFTSFRKPDAITGMYMVSRSTRSHHVYGQVIEVSRIVRSCHLLPKHGAIKDSQWDSLTVLDACKTFHVNSYIDFHMYLLLRMNRRDAVPH